MKIEAYSPEWYEARLDLFTASHLYDLICKPKKKHLPRPYVIQKAIEIDTRVSQESDFESEDMLHGTENELLAVNWVGKTLGLTLEPTSYFLKHPDLLFGATADRYAYDKDGNKISCEIKCPKSTTHIGRLYIEDWKMLKEVEPKIYWQIVGGALAGECKKGLFADFDHRVNPECGLFYILFDIPEADFELAVESIKQGEKDVKKVLAKMRGVSTPRTEAPTKKIELKKIA